MDWDTIPSFLTLKPSAPAVPVAQGPGYPAEFGAAASPAPSQVVNPEQPVQVSQTPIQTFLGDINIPALATQTIDIFSQIGSNCVGFVLIPLGTGVQVSINGGGFRTIPSLMVVDESVVNTLVVVGGTLGAILQLNGV
jgi:hypothetical protein